MKGNEVKKEEIRLIPLLQDVIADLLSCHYRIDKCKDPTDENSLDSIIMLQKELVELGNHIATMPSIEVSTEELLKIEAGYNAKLEAKL
jgi:hypothetical protein